jgi:hypothetical protein
VREIRSARSGICRRIGDWPISTTKSRQSSVSQRILWLESVFRISWQGEELAVISSSVLDVFARLPLLGEMAALRSHFQHRNHFGRLWAARVINVEQQSYRRYIATPYTLDSYNSSYDLGSVQPRPSARTRALFPLVHSLVIKGSDYLAANLLLARILAPKKYRAKMPPTQEACEEDLYHVSLELELTRTND